MRGALVDVYSASIRSDLFDHPDIVAKKKIVYPNAYGLVLSGDLKNAASAFKDYLNVNGKVFLDDMKTKTAGLEVLVCFLQQLHNHITQFKGHVS